MLVLVLTGGADRVREGQPGDAVRGAAPAAVVLGMVLAGAGGPNYHTARTRRPAWGHRMYGRWRGQGGKRNGRPAWGYCAGGGMTGVGTLLGMLCNTASPPMGAVRDVVVVAAGPSRPALKHTARDGQAELGVLHRTAVYGIPLPPG